MLKKHHVLVILGLALAAFFVVGCASEEPAPVGGDVKTATEGAGEGKAAGAANMPKATID
ncbi:MAG: hypothetical protein KIT11_03485 [Fimbriimonadaceae bacterium]|nr:hypothetical protein [Fimbriimonadaceae bacterium]QYK57040.1 MAG: hypothetical protein KF733_06040 [Fimbriimonadaceae bacterium]